MFESKKEMAQAMLDGKVVEFDNNGIAYFDDTDDCSPFVYNLPPVGKSALNMAWDWYKEAGIKKEWYDTVSKEKPKICWVSGLDGDRQDFVARIVKRDDWLYVDSVGTRWGYATPVKPEELGG